MKYSVKEMLKDPSGRKKLAEMQKRHRIEILQPSDPLFERVYGERRRKNKEALAKQERAAKDMWEESKIRREFEKSRKIRSLRSVSSK